MRWKFTQPSYLLPVDFKLETYKNKKIKKGKRHVFNWCTCVYKVYAQANHSLVQLTVNLRLNAGSNNAEKSNQDKHLKQILKKNTLIENNTSSDKRWGKSTEMNNMALIRGV